jgi:hypothetical protein
MATEVKKEVPPLKKFLVLFKGYKQYNIRSQDDETAQKWVDKQMEFWGKTYKVSITPVLIEDKKEEIKEEKK